MSDDDDDLESRRAVLDLLRDTQRRAVLSLLQTAQLALISAREVAPTSELTDQIHAAHVALGKTITFAERAMPRRSTERG